MSFYRFAYSTKETIDNTLFYTEQILLKSIPGTLVECGVAAGAQVAAMQSVLLARKSPRIIYGFDSFQGIPLASEEDDQQPGIPGPKPQIEYTDKRELLKSSGITVHSKSSVIQSLNTWFSSNRNHNIRLVEGWFQDTIEPTTTAIAQEGGIALLRLDGDLYESTKVCLEHLFPLLNTGGILIIDDWELTGCRRACEEYFTTHPVLRLKPRFGNGSGPAYFQK